MNNPRSRLAGMTLIEVMVATLIFSLGVLGLVAMQAKATSLSRDAEDRNRAALLANEGVSMLWNCCATGTTTLPAAQYAQWKLEVAAPAEGATPTSSAGLLGLPQGVGTIVQGGAAFPGQWTVTITWQEPTHNTTDQYITQVNIVYP